MFLGHKIWLMVQDGFDPDEAYIAIWTTYVASARTLLHLAVEDIEG